MAFTNPYFHAAQAIMVSENSQIKRLSDLRHKRIIYIIGGTAEPNLKQLFPNAQLIGFKSHTDAFSAFHAGRGDAFCSDDSILYGFLHEYCGFRLLKERLSEEPYGIAFRKDAFSQPLVQAVQAILDDMAQQGALEELIQQWYDPTPPKECV